LKGYDNLFYEICNEPYFGGVTMEWQHHIADTITAAETGFRNKHLIAQNIANYSAKIESPHPSVSLFNFHYARPPEAVAANYGLNKAIGYDETGFDGTADATYRVQAWDFLSAGGATYDHLDFSFVAGHEDGSFQYPASQPGGGSSELRRQFRILKDFMESFDFVKMRPDDAVIGSGVPEGASGRALAENGAQYAIYIHHGKPVKKGKPPYQIDAGQKTARLSLRLPVGSYKAEWVDTKTGAVAKTETLSGASEATSPAYSEDIALRIKRQ
jgi:hypothetical protein